MREQDRKEKERVEQFWALLKGELALAQEHIEIALMWELEQRINDYAMLHDVVTLQQQGRSTRTSSLHKTEVKEELTSFQEALYAYRG